MKKILLTSAGFENPVVRDCFLELLGRPPEQARALFIPTAAIDEDAKAVLPKCRGDLLGAGIPPEHITDFDLDRPMDLEELSGYDVVYFCGGSTKHLLEQVKARGFDRVLDMALERGLVYVGVSAGSIISAENLPGNLGYLPRRLEVHCEAGSPRGALPEGTVYLTNAQAVRIAGAKKEIIGEGEMSLDRGSLAYRERLISEYFSRWIENDPEILEKTFTEDVVYSECFGPEYRGICQIKRWFDDWHKKGRVLEWTIKSFLHQGNQTAVEWFFRCDYDGESGFDGVSLIEFTEDGRIRSLKEFQSKAEHEFPYGRNYIR